MINNTNGVDSFALQIFARQLPDRVVPASHATLLILVLSSFAAFIYLCAAVQPLPQLAIAMTAIALVGVLLGSGGRTPDSAAQRSHARSARTRELVDRAVGGGSDVALVAGAGVRALPLEETAFANGSITHVYRTCKVVLGADFGERQLTLDPSGALRLPVRSRSARVMRSCPPRSTRPAGVLGRDPAGHLVLLAPLERPCGYRATGVRSSTARAES